MADHEAPTRDAGDGKRAARLVLGIEWVLAGALVAAVTVAAVLAGTEVYYLGDRMFPMMLLGLFPLVAALILLAVIFSLFRRWVLVWAGLLSAVFLAGTIIMAPAIQSWAWQRSILRYEDVNRQILEAAEHLPELDEDELRMGPEDDFAPVVDGIRWYCDHHIAAPDGEFRAFRYKGVIHVRVQKVRHAYRGIAYIPDGQDLPAPKDNAAITYLNRVGSDWAIWNTQPNIR